LNAGDEVLGAIYKSNASAPTQKHGQARVRENASTPRPRVLKRMIERVVEY
jgi:hypothetical protein